MFSGGGRVALSTFVFPTVFSPLITFLDEQSLSLSWGGGLNKISCDSFQTLDPRALWSAIQLRTQLQPPLLSSKLGWIKASSRCIYHAWQSIGLPPTGLTGRFALLRLYCCQSLGRLPAPLLLLLAFVICPVRIPVHPHG